MNIIENTSCESAADSIRILNLPNEFLHDKKILNVGGGCSDLPIVLSRLGSKVLSIDPIYSLSDDEILKKTIKDVTYTVTHDFLPSQSNVTDSEKQLILELTKKTIQERVLQLLQFKSYHPEQFIADATPNAIAALSECEIDIGISFNCLFKNPFHTDKSMIILRTMQKVCSQIRIGISTYSEERLAPLVQAVPDIPNIERRKHLQAGISSFTLFQTSKDTSPYLQPEVSHF